jgi:hypothetical protein
MVCLRCNMPCCVHDRCDVWVDQQTSMAHAAALHGACVQHTLMRCTLCRLSRGNPARGTGTQRGGTATLDGTSKYSHGRRGRPSVMPSAFASRYSFAACSRT